MSEKLKFVKLEDNSVIIFPCIIEHVSFKNFKPVTAGFCYINAEKKRVDCFGESFSLRMKSDIKDDSLCATRQVFGIDAMIKLM